MKTTLLRRLEERGYRARVVSIRRLHDLQEAIEGGYRQGLLDRAFYQERLTGFGFEPPEDLPGARSLIVVTYGDPQVRFIFNWRGERLPVVVPPTYLHWQEKDRQVERTLAEFLESDGYRAVQALVPKKLLAARSGLVVYGKNNVTYVYGLGSLHRLAAFCSDLPCEQDHWGQPRMMERCEQCRACLRGCPTSAIVQERFVLRAERCLTFWNEKPRGVAFPEWVESPWHNCLVGCMQCQRICPENKSRLSWYEEGAEFSVEETALLLEGLPLTELPGALAEKLERWDLVDWLDILPRNLKALLEGRNSQPS
ncbi:MAG: 4Fe-4S double cluster binding domain-containing protein [Anaerolineae bacterium]|jgi:epoxyqueuosine reductase